jgi:MYXO-CTERM domain-containing protein
MKKLILTSVLMLLMWDSRAALYVETFNSGASVGAIPDASVGGIVGVSFSGVVSDVPSGYDIISSISIVLHISGGYNNDLYSYLRAPDGTVVVLFNQPGSAYVSGSGYNLLLGANGTSSIQTATQTAGQVFGNGTTMYQTAGDMLSFNDHLANGTWTLFFQDLSPGASSTLTGWSLSIAAVPEPAQWGMIAGAGLLGMCGFRVWQRRRKQICN